MKKTFAFIFIILSLIVLVSCTSGPIDFEPITNELSQIFSEGDSLDSVTKDLTLKNESLSLPGAKIFWRSSNENVIKISKAQNLGVVNTMFEEDEVEVDIILRIIYKFNEYLETFTVKVIGEDYFTIKFDLNNEEEVIIKNSFANKKAILIENPVKEGYTFLHWNNKATNVEFDVDMLLTENIELIAVYEINKFEITITDQDNVITLTQDWGSVLLLDEPSKDNFIFTGWFIVGTEKKFDLLTLITDDLALESRFTNEMYTVIVDGGNAVTIPWGTVLDLFAPDATVEGEEFAGWFYVGTNDEFVANTPITKDITLESRFRLQTFTVTVDGIEQLVNWGEKAILVESTKEGHTFKVWMDTDLSSPFNVETIIKGNYNIEAHYDVNIYTVTADEIEYEVNWGDKANLPIPTKLGYEFDSWYLDEDLTLEFDNDTLIKEDTTLIAKWNKEFTLTLSQGLEVDIEGPYYVEVELIVTITNPADKVIGTLEVNDVDVTNDVISNTYTIIITTDTIISVEYTLNPELIKDDLMIYEIYGGGGNKDATYTHDYIVLYNSSEKDIDLSYYSLQYAAADIASKFSNSYTLSGIIEKSSYYSIRMSGGINGDYFPIIFDDLEGTLNLAASNGKVALVFRDKYISGPEDGNVIDYVAFGNGDPFLGTGPAASPKDNGPSMQRTSLVNTKDNAVDFVSSAIDLAYLPQAPTYTVIFDSNGGDAITNKTVIKGDVVKEPLVDMLNYAFDGWYENEDLTSTVWDFNNKILSDITLYAKWIAPYEVTFKSEGLEHYVSLVKPGDKAETPHNPYKTGFWFDGWYKDAVEFDFDVSVRGNIVLEAKFSEIASDLEEILGYQTGFEATEEFKASTAYQNDEIALHGPLSKQWGVYYGTPSTTGAIVGNQSAQMRYYPASPEKLGYLVTTFVLNNVSKVEFKASKTSTIGLVVFYSTDNGITWQGKEEYNLTTTATAYTYNIGVSGDVMIKFQLTADSATTSAARLYIDDVKIYNYVEAGQTVDVSFETNGAAAISPITVNLGGSLVLPLAPMKEGFDFVGWYTDIELVNEFYENHIFLNNMSLYAKWSEKVSAGTKVEDFENSELGSGYTNGSFIGVENITWTYVESRDENGDANNSGIDGKAIMLRRVVDNSKITSSPITGGIGSLSLKLYKGFTGKGNRQVEVLINGISQGLSTPFDDKNEHIFTIDDINITGDIIIEIINKTSTQVIIDDITWISYS